MQLNEPHRAALTLIGTPENARVAVSSRGWASATAAGSSVTARGFSGAAAERTALKTRAETIEENMVKAAGCRVREQKMGSRSEKKGTKKVGLVERVGEENEMGEWTDGRLCFIQGKLIAPRRWSIDVNMTNLPTSHVSITASRNLST